MKRIPLKSVQMTTPDGKEMELNYWAQLQMTMRTPMNVQQGADVEEIRKSIRILDALDKIDRDAEFLELEDSDHEYLVTKVSATKFTFVAPELVQFVDDVTIVEEE
jgi:hypothetical protein